jgi:hypothetical protein
MALQTSASYTNNLLEAVRYQLETVGYWEGTVIAANFDDSPAVLISIDGLSLGTTFPVPIDSTVFCDIQYTTYGDASTDYGQMGDIRVGGGRDGSGNAVVAQIVNTSTTYIEQDATACLEFNTGATANSLTFAATADTTNQGIDITVSGTASSATYLVGRMRLVCAKKDGLPRKYSV